MNNSGSADRPRQFAETLVDGMRTRLYPALHAVDKGKAERLIHTTLREWGCARHHAPSDERAAVLRPWTHAYNLAPPTTASKASFGQR